MYEPSSLNCATGGGTGGGGRGKGKGGQGGGKLKGKGGKGAKGGKGKRKPSPGATSNSALIPQSHAGKKNKKKSKQQTKHSD